MKKILILIVLSCLISMKSQANEKLGVVDVQKVLNTIEEGKKAQADFDKKMAAKKNELEKKQKEVQKLNDNLEKQKMILSSTAVEEKRKELEGKAIELQKAQFAAQSEMQNMEQELTKPIFKKIKAIIEKVGRDGGYDFVWEKTEGGVVYSKPAFDLTDTVIAQYDKTYKK